MLSLNILSADNENWNEEKGQQKNHFLNKCWNCSLEYKKYFINTARIQFPSEILMTKMNSERFNIKQIFFLRSSKQTIAVFFLVIKIIFKTNPLDYLNAEKRIIKDKLKRSWKFVCLWYNVDFNIILVYMYLDGQSTQW